jgi:hypothetical protein
VYSLPSKYTEIFKPVNTEYSRVNGKISMRFLEKHENK